MIPSIAIAGVGLALAYSTLRGPKNIVEVRSSLDNRTYRVQNLPNKQGACNLMSKIRQNLEKIVESFKNDPNYKQDEPIQRMISRFNPNVLEENDMDADSTSYSENKGEKIVVCLRDKTKKPDYPLVEENTVMFVLIHEMAHLMTASMGHTPEFWTNFKKLLHDCVKLGVYQNVNYAKQPIDYCGMTITDSPI
jgi:hypothetical protein